MTTKKRKKHIIEIVLFFVILILLNACNRSSSGSISTPPISGDASLTPVSLAVPSITPIPSPTQEPSAALVNGTPIFLVEYQAESARFAAAKAKTNLDPEEKSRVITELIDQTLLAQSAYQTGYVLDDAQLQQRLNDLIQKAGGNQAFEAWLTANQYIPETFLLALRRSIAAAWMRDQIASQIPQSMPQMHARQILFFDQNLANQTLARLQAGEIFLDVVKEFDPLVLGDLGWFPAGFLLQPELDVALFQANPPLQAGQITSIIQTRLGYHILFVEERSDQRPLSSEIRLTLQQKALQTWIEEQRTKSQIQILLPESEGVHVKTISTPTQN